jgi:membrane associated rhomboid family serine protease
MSRRDYFDKKPLLGANNNALVWLLAINCCICIVLNFLFLVFKITNDTTTTNSYNNSILQWFMLRPNAHELLQKPWTLVTYMVSHFSFWPLLSNCLWLWAFGYIMQDLMGNKQIIPLYIYGGLAGGIVYILTASYIPALRQNAHTFFAAEGAGFAVMAIVIATTVLSPTYKIYPFVGNGIPLFVLTLVYIGFNVITIIAANTAYVLGYLAAAIMGYIYVKQLQNGNDWGAWMHKLVAWVGDLYNPQKSNKQQLAKQNFYKTSQPTFTKTPNLNQQKIDSILDKINKYGYSKLSQEDKDFLDKASKGNS